jgi:hypothetical protein
LRQLVTAALLAVACGCDLGNDASRDGGSDGSLPAGDDGGGAPGCGPSWEPSDDCGNGFLGAPDPDFGPNVLIFDDTMKRADIQARLDAVYAEMDANHFGPQRYAYFFKPGHYFSDVRLGFYMQALGLGRSPDDVLIDGAVRVKADWLGDKNATQSFWRGAENILVGSRGDIDDGANVFAVSQATHLRRMHFANDLRLSDGDGWSSGGFIADTLVDGTIFSGSQQQFLTRNDEQRWSGSNWNMVFVGDEGAPAPSWPHPPYTIVERTPVVREKPFLYLDEHGRYLVMVPDVKRDSRGRSWAAGAPPGSPIAIDRFYIAHPGDGSAALGQALADGKHLLFTPGVYHVAQALAVTRPGTVILGLGLATLVADAGNALFAVADVDAVTIGGLILEAGPLPSETLLELGPGGSSADHAARPTALFDVSCRVGGTGPGSTGSCIVVNSRHVIFDNLWLWRADHGDGVRWDLNPADSGLVVNGDDVTAYGLFVEHFQKAQTRWNGNGGSVYLYQSELPYDPPSQDAWMAAPGHRGYASYQVGDGVTRHQAYGLGVYAFFWNAVTAENAVEAPSGNTVNFQHMMTVSLKAGGIAHILNGTGDGVGNGGPSVSYTDY